MYIGFHFEAVRDLAAVFTATIKAILARSAQLALISGFERDLLMKLLFVHGGRDILGSTRYRGDEVARSFTVTIPIIQDCMTYQP